MNISYIVAADVENADALKEYAAKKVEDCAKLLGELEETALCDVDLKYSRPQQSGPVHYAEVNIQAGGELFRATAEEHSFEAAIDKVKDELLRELKRAKEKKIDHTRKGGAQAKDMLRGEE